MADQLYLKPAEGKRIPNPDAPATPDLPPHGAAVPNSRYWRRLLADRDVIATTAEAIAAGEAALAAPVAAIEAPAKSSKPVKEA